jgi:hypothetical protein
MIDLFPNFDDWLSEEEASEIIEHTDLPELTVDPIRLAKDINEAYQKYLEKKWVSENKTYINKANKYDQISGQSKRLLKSLDIDLENEFRVHPVGESHFQDSIVTALDIQKPYNEKVRLFEDGINALIKIHSASAALSAVFPEDSNKTNSKNIKATPWQWFLGYGLVKVYEDHFKPWTSATNVKGEAYGSSVRFSLKTLQKLGLRGTPHGVQSAKSDYEAKLIGKKSENEIKS